MAKIIGEGGIAVNQDVLPGEPGAWYRPSPMILEFHASKVKTRCLIGGRGSGKTTAIAVEVIGHCWHNAGAKAYILRKTQDSNDNTTLETFSHQVFPEMGTAYQDTGVSLFKKIDGGKIFRLPSRLAVNKFNKWLQEHPGATKQQKLVWLDSVGNHYCSFVFFAGVPEQRYRASRFRGYECSMLIFVEADQLAKEDLDLGMATLRWKGADPETCDPLGFIKDTCVILDTNPPGFKHWIAVMELGDDTTSPDPHAKFWHLRTADNAHNLPKDYVITLEHQYRKNPAMLSRMVYGQYADAFEGQPVFFAFEVKHTRESLPWPQGAYLVRGWDFGTTQSVVWSAYWQENDTEYWWDMFEYFALQSDVERQCRAVLELTQAAFPFWNDRLMCQGVKDYCDIAGNQVTDKGSSVQVLRTFGIYPGWSKVGLQESIAVVNRLFEKEDVFGNPVYRIDSKCCPMLNTALSGGYRYPVEGEAGYGGNEPLKGPAGGNFDHIADASRYAKYNALRLIRAEVEKSKGTVGKLARKETLNRNKRYY